ncbi:MAG: HAMP domain-containing protein, partial [Bdellovibrionales bacterium]|nr:HAMP domain-containing protein [Bdellovibrionales bacterium]
MIINRVKIVHKLIFCTLLAALLIIGVGLYAVYVSEHHLRETIAVKAQADAQTAFEEIDRFIHSRVAEWRAYAASPQVQKVLLESNESFVNFSNIQSEIDLRDLQWRDPESATGATLISSILASPLSRELRNHLELYKREFGFPVYAEVFLTNKFGANVAASNQTSDYRQDDEKWWRDTKEKGVFLGDVQFDRSASAYSIDLGIKIVDENGEFIGVFKVVMDVGLIQRIIDARSQALSKFAPNHIVLFNAQQQIVHQSMSNLKPLADGSEWFSQIPDDRPPVISVVRKGSDGEQYLSTYVFSESLDNKFEFFWTLLVEFKQDNLFARLKRMRDRIVWGMILAVLFAATVGLRFSFSIRRRYDELREVTKKLGSGDLTARAVVGNYRDELSELTKALNLMAQSLQDAQERLEDLVDVAQSGE